MQETLPHLFFRGEDSHIIKIPVTVEEHEEGDFSVLLPTAPNPTVGAIYYIKKDRVHQLDVPPSQVINCITQ